MLISLKKEQVHDVKAQPITAHAMHTLLAPASVRAQVQAALHAHIPRQILAAMSIPRPVPDLA